jgi:threonine aldolase
MIIDLRSDTFTKPTADMKAAMFDAEVGDDVFGEDPTVNALEQKAADLFGMEAGLFCASGTQTNQVAINVHTKPGDDIVCDQFAHIHFYEGGGIAANSGASVSLVPGDKGLLTAFQIENAIKVDNVHFPRTRMVGLENTSNKGGGTIYSRSAIEEISKLCSKHKLAYHLDGARVFNAIVESDYTAHDLGQQFHSISICLSKGLGAPVGSVLLGSNEFIHQARRVRKRFGGGMRQAGYLAAAGIYALDNHIDVLKHDHEKAKYIGWILGQLPEIETVEPVETNIVMCEVNADVDAQQLVDRWAKNGIKALVLGPGKIRLVTHLDVTDEMMSEIDILFKKQ